VNPFFSKLDDFCTPRVRRLPAFSASEEQAAFKIRVFWTAGVGPPACVRNRNPERRNDLAASAGDFRISKPKKRPAPAHFDRREQKMVLKTRGPKTYTFLITERLPLEAAAEIH
jgi:hypothetical protein